jgi:hypothetical protein
MIYVKRVLILRLSIFQFEIEGPMPSIGDEDTIEFVCLQALKGHSLEWLNSLLGGELFVFSQTP